MKVLLVHAYCLAADPGEQQVMKPYPPLGVLYLSAWLKRHGYDVSIFDGTFEEPDALARAAARFQPEIVGFYANMMTRHRVLAGRKALADLKALFVVGGPDPPHYADDYLDAGFDVVIEGEGERPMLALLQNKPWHDIPGLMFRSNGETQKCGGNHPDLDLETLPFPDREGIRLENYLACWEKHHGMRPISLITSRGCPFRCTWCSHNVFGHSLRKRSVDSVLAEMEHLAQGFNFTHYWFADDVFNIKPKWLHQLNEQMPDGLRKPFECIVRADRMDQALVDTLQQLQCFRCWVGAESGSQRLLDTMKRGVKRKRVIEVVHLLRSAGIETGMFFMWGFADETYEDILQTVDLAASANPNIALTTVAYPIKGTAHYQMLEDQGHLGNPPDFSTGTDRDISILNQQGPAVYQLANRLLHTRLSQARLRRGPLVHRLKSVAQGIRGNYFQKVLRRSFTDEN